MVGVICMVRRRTARRKESVATRTARENVSGL
jgi:hypothetical protein